MSLIVTGSIGIDTVITPTGRADDILGGSCTYFAAAASFFAPVRIVAVVGEDFPHEHMAVFEHFKIDATGLEKRIGSKTFRWTGQYRTNINERDTLDVQPNVLAEGLAPVPAPFRDTPYVFLANTHPAGQLALREQFPAARLVVADTMDLWLNTALDDLKQVLRKIDGLVLNDSEAAQLAGELNMIRAADAILDMGPKFVVIKKGEHGCLLRHADGLAVLPAFPATQVVDPTGAGDSFAGGMMGYLTEVDRTDFAAIRKALVYGTIVASYNIESFSLDRLRLITRADIDQRVTEFCHMLTFDG